jgi:hypothetical protein
VAQLRSDSNGIIRCVTSLRNAGVTGSSPVSGTTFLKALPQGNPALTGGRAFALGGAWVLAGATLGRDSRFRHWRMTLASILRGRGCEPSTSSMRRRSHRQSRNRADTSRSSDNIFGGFSSLTACRLLLAAFARLTPHRCQASCAPWWREVLECEADRQASCLCLGCS